MHRDRTTHAWRALYDQAQAIIERDAHHGGLSLAGVADELAVSPRQLQRIYREIGQTSFRTARCACAQSGKWRRWSATISRRGSLRRSAATGVSYRTRCGSTGSVSLEGAA
jgi:AraC-like DNA-binding protein